MQAFKGQQNVFPRAWLLPGYVTERKIPLPPQILIHFCHLCCAFPKFHFFSFGDSFWSQINLISKQLETRIVNRIAGKCEKLILVLWEGNHFTGYGVEDVIWRFGELYCNPMPL